MTGIPPNGARGILHARAAEERFQVRRIAPPAGLAALVEFFWLLRWDLRGRPAHRQRVLTRPSVHLTFTSYLTTGATRARIVGVVRDDFVEEIAGEGRVVGAAFRPGGFRPFLDGPVSSVTGRFVPVPEVFGGAGRALGEKIFATPDGGAALGLLEAFLSGLGAEAGPQGERAARAVDRIAARPGPVQVGELADGLGMSTRSVQRLFHEYVGIGPKWVIRRFRMQEAAERAAAGGGVDWAALAAELGYADQAHFTRDFTASVGTSPARYARDAGPRPGGA
ncbi:MULTISPECIES: helix-turn-helix domain-containing protein [Thermomonosporaceae]|uniref:helix-turn-helix domain-containing protein n=1 Tax=Thermomonosporaceae TaxID=2012 RepID=UPI00255B3682|nr:MULTISPECIES: AraC family transcriptional regulator [Thermomonosporaceae]MDL4770545.1 AraC family transcriptional regulator [Actinomadura xylanilytica]